jgi:hypothetical protein
MTDSKPTYRDLLRDPRWQRLRLEVMERARWKCEECGDGSTTLNVHHTYYVRGHAPWEYPSDTLHCWCETCHEKHHVMAERLRRLVGAMGLAGVWRMIGYAHGTWMVNQPPSDAPIDIRVGLIDGVADAWGLTVADLEAIADEDGYVTTNALWAARRTRRR